LWQKDADKQQKYTHQPQQDTIPYQSRSHSRNQGTIAHLALPPPATHGVLVGLYWVSLLASPVDSPPRVRRAQSQSGPLKQILRTHLRTFLDHSEGTDTSRFLPAHITRELHAFVRCGDPTFGFARLRCPSCLFDQLIPFSCKGRGFCPSCAGRRMAAIAAHLTDHVLPDEPLRQWVLCG
jgi:hypothetical protein